MAESLPSPPTPTGSGNSSAAAPPNWLAQSAGEKLGPAAADTKSFGTTTDPMREVLDRFVGWRDGVASTDPTLARTLHRLSEQGADPERRLQPGFRTEVAYALQDLQRVHPGSIVLSAQFRDEMARLAASALGLENERMQALLRATGTLDDRKLIQEIRTVGAEIGRRIDQTAPAIESRIGVLENKVRLAGRAPEQTPPGRDNAAEMKQRPVSVTSQPPDIEMRRPPETTPASGEAANRRQFGGAPQGDIRVRDQTANASPVTVQHSVLDTLLRAMRPDGRQPSGPWVPSPTPMADRIAAEERRTLADQDSRAFSRAEAAGQAALQALQAFTFGEAASVMSKIREAARSAPGGMTEVLSEMRQGGRFADLRMQFNNALTDDAGVVAAYDKAATALAAYGTNRSDVHAIVGRRADANALVQRFQNLDAEIGAAAAATPSRTEGRSMMDDLAHQAAELLQRAVDAVKSAFSRSPASDAAPRPAPSPGP